MAEESEQSGADETRRPQRREFLGKILMTGGLLVSYGVLLVESFLFLLPVRGKGKRRRLFIGRLSHFPPGSVSKIYDLRGNEVLIKRAQSAGPGDTDLRAFSSVCPHLGCRVQWEEKNRRFFCPCHNGIFDAEGVATAGPPAQAKQKLEELPLHIDQADGRVYLEVGEVST